MIQVLLVEFQEATGRNLHTLVSANLVHEAVIRSESRLVCHSLEEGWKNQTEIIKKCFDSIEGDEPIASISIGTGLVGMLSGADFGQIKDGMELSEKEIILY